MKFIDHIQMAYFTVPRPDPLDAGKVWALIYGEPGPDEFRRIPNSPGKQTIAGGATPQGQVTISSQIGRIDLTVNVPPDAVGDQPFLDNPVAILAELTKGAALIQEQCPLTRGAFVLNQLLPLEGSATDMIEAQTGAKFPKNSIDPMIQYNIQATEDGSSTFQVNQLSTWSVANLQLVQFDTTGATPFAVRTDQRLSHKVDVNTVPNQSLQNVDVAHVFTRLAERAAARLENPTSGSDA
ncbi:hypothetical protein [Bradyrhizobium glycinis]|uniref:hypothetical protein n=1 Tax=Bradyrhizobium glycinis TaxID=2751812 RepID=UPI0018D92AAC|nr:hypothetical protein [Bradyrhizobium glycinis]MBH5372812.1 hypothetical protein [Bradyrhizobium glycinis]